MNVLILSEAQRDQLDALNKSCPFPGRQLKPAPTEDGRWVLRREILDDPYWAHWRPLLDTVAKANIQRALLLDTRIRPDVDPATRPYAIAMRSEHERINRKP